jgi:hybrid cluster-associated redox disulfide protein
MKKLNKKMTFREIIEENPESIEVLLNSGMHCFGCPMAQMETLEEGAMAHGLNPDELIEKINSKIKPAKKSKK